ncbi:MAG: TonB-dependent receptor [Alphaproteobacteria bacterium]|nr:TonB-dependent receptor [Alphaproteobacteria bacterium]
MSRFWVGLLLLLSLPTVAWAEPKDDARRHFAAGLKAAQEGDYEEALTHFLAAQAAFPHPASLYNIAKAYADLGRTQDAIDTYEAFQEASPDQAASVEPILVSLRARLAESQAPVPAPAPTAAPAPVVVRPVPVEGSGDVTRLQELAAQLDAISRELAAASGAEIVPAPAPAPVGAAPVEPEVVDTAFQEDAYERVVVTASRVGQDPLDSPSTVTVLTADDIRLSGATDVPDLLRRVVGVDVMSAASGHSDVAIRGFQRKINNKVLVLIDGRSTYLDFLGATFWAAFPVELEEIERIEVIRGPGSAVYGANAVTGVINVITRTPGEGQQSVAFDAGTPGYARASGVATGRSGPTAWRLSAGLQKHGSWALQTNVPADDPSVEPFLDTDNPLGLDVLRANARVDRTIGDDAAVSVSAGLMQGTSEFYNIGALPEFGLDMRHHYVRADALAGNLHVWGFWNSYTGRTGPWLAFEGERSLDSTFDNEVVDAEFEAPTQFDTGPVHHTLNAGGGWRYKYIRFGFLEGGADTPYVENHYQAFVNEQAMWGRVGGVVSLRVDAHPLIPLTQTISPRLALLVRPARATSIRATAGSAYRAPTAIESYMGFALPTTVDGIYIEDKGNRDLSPERIGTLELGIHDESTAYHVADAVVYVARVTDLIGLADVTTGFYPFDPTEEGIVIGETGWINETAVATAYGAEGEIEVFPADGVDLFGNVAVRQTRETDQDVAIVDRSSSELMLNAGGSVRTPWRTDLTLEGHYLTAQDWRLRTFDPETLQIVDIPAHLDARFLMSGRVAVRPIPDEDLEFAFVAWNPLAGSFPFREHPEGQTLSSRWIGQVAWRF